MDSHWDKLPEILQDKITLTAMGRDPHPTAKIMKKVHSRIEEKIHYRVTTDHYIGAGEYGRERLNNYETKIKKRRLNITIRTFLTNYVLFIFILINISNK